MIKIFDIIYVQVFRYNEQIFAFSDSLIEMEIFVRCLRTHKRFTKNCHQWDCKGKDANKCFPKWAE